MDVVPQRHGSQVQAYLVWRRQRRPQLVINLDLFVDRARRLDPGGHPLAAQGRESGAGNRLGAEHGVAQSFVGVDDARHVGG